MDISGFNIKSLTDDSKYIYSGMNNGTFVFNSKIFNENLTNDIFTYWEKNDINQNSYLHYILY